MTSVSDMTGVRAALLIRQPRLSTGRLIVPGRSLEAGMDSGTGFAVLDERPRTSEVGHGGRGIEAVSDRAFFSPQGPAPSLEGDLSAAGDHAARALRDAGGSGGFRRGPALGRDSGA